MLMTTFKVRRRYLRSTLLPTAALIIFYFRVVLHDVLEENAKLQQEIEDLKGEVADLQRRLRKAEAQTRKRMRESDDGEGDIHDRSKKWPPFRYRESVL
jgi:regulator of replication initiation timing